MRKINYSRKFLKNFQKRIARNRNLDSKFREKLDLFQLNSASQDLKDHKLTGNLEGFRAFSITGDIRVVYRIVDVDTLELYDIGNHNQVY